MDYNPDFFVEYEKSWSKFPDLLRPETEVAVFRIQATELMGKSWLLYRMKAHCESQKIPVVHIDFADLPYEIPDFIGWMQLFGDSFSAPDLFVPLDRAVREYQISENREPLSVLIRLRDYLSERFPSHNELEMFVAEQFDLKYDNLRGETLSEKLYELILLFFNQQRLPALFNALRDAFPPSVHFDWQPFLDDIAAHPPAFLTGATIRGGFNEYTPAQKVLIDVFFDCLTAYVKARGKTVLLLDAYDKITDEIERWFINIFLPRLDDDVLRTVVVVVAGAALDVNAPLIPQVSRLFHASVVDLIAPPPPKPAYQLQPFAKEQVKDYIENKRNLSQNETFNVEDLLWYTKGVPGKVARLADQRERELSGRDSKDSDLGF